MTWLDCSALGSTTACLASALEVEGSSLCDAFVGYDEEVFDDTSEEPLVRMPREICEQLDRDITSVTFEGSVYFHGTRVLDPSCFRQAGIQPLGALLEQIWQMLFNLASDICTPAEWSTFRKWVEGGGGEHDGHLYRLKSRDAMHHGPYGVLVREMFFRRSEVNIHDFLECPEIIQDICRCFRSYRGVDLETPFYEVSTPVVVSFRGPFTGLGSVTAAFWYVYNQVRDGSVSGNSNGGFNGGGAPVGADLIISVDIVELGDLPA